MDIKSFITSSAPSSAIMDRMMCAPGQGMESPEKSCSRKLLQPSMRADLLSSSSFTKRTLLCCVKREGFFFVHSASLKVRFEASARTFIVSGTNMLPKEASDTCSRISGFGLSFDLSLSFGFGLSDFLLGEGLGSGLSPELLETLTGVAAATGTVFGARGATGTGPRARTPTTRNCCSSHSYSSSESPTRDATTGTALATAVTGSAATGASPASPPSSSSPFSSSSSSSSSLLSPASPSRKRVSTLSRPTHISASPTVSCFSPWRVFMSRNKFAISMGTKAERTPTR